ncbi:MAG: ABC transporter ATP-binding protein [Erysipelotrichia bacterium]|jgi:ABC-2 type transport system ATP-binding protein|nr:ABC transporter ATP-binding protein [Erysipelotrichia bacterium]
MLQIMNVTKSYDKKKNAIENVDLTIEPGDLYGFVGPNGAGKTTLIKCIVGIINYDNGKITLNGKTLLEDSILFKSQIAYIPDHPDLYESLSGRQFIDFIADAYRVSLERRNELTTLYAKEFEMEHALDLSISTYSHGMKQKIALMAALVHEPKLIILDEPFVGLDPKASYILKQLFQKITSEGVMILFSSHVLEVVEKLCTKIAIIKEGHIIADGKTNEVLKDQSLEKTFLELT